MAVSESTIEGLGRTPSPRWCPRKSGHPRPFPATGVLAIDCTTIPYFGEDRAHKVLTKGARGTQYGWQLATVYLCHRGMRFTLHAVPVDQFSKKGEVVSTLRDLRMDFLIATTAPTSPRATRGGSSRGSALSAPLGYDLVPCRVDYGSR